ncbi:MAG: glucans biosynthesis glucosyltransferase MdoH [Alphaproteobacteria bacterium]|nr:glucans biosynthesis glucosyltransferase MdoH [Alphaproteobacteria bacterium]
MDDMSLDAVARGHPGRPPPRAALPAASPLAMPRQGLWTRGGPDAPRAAGYSGVAWTRGLVIGTAVAATIGAALEMLYVLEVGGLTILEASILVLFVALFAWIALAFTSAVAGFVAMVGGGGRPLGIATAGPLPAVGVRTAILMPAYNESPVRVMAGLQAIHDSLAETGALDRFDFFILSDTTDPEIWIAEEAAFLALRARTGGHDRIFYRRRPKNVERKAGNIADWVTRFGGAYPQMLVLDADSVMTGDAIVRLAAAMEAHPRVGLIQTLPMLVAGETLLARMQQFAGRVYGPLIAHGIATWHGGEGNYWGHNAIIRTRAFAEAAGLPHLAGRKPFGGHVLSHDFVEAALLRRRGWTVHMAPALAGSYEEGPPSLTDLAVRDRRWCQGNLQHAAILPARGLHWVSRLHLLMGIGSYVTAPMWLLFLCVGMLVSLQARFIRPEYFPAEFSLFPQWPAQDPVRAMWVFAGTMGLLLAPKLLAYVALLLDPAARRGCGGAVRAFASVVVETVLAGLLAPVTMLGQSVAVLSILMGRDSGWQPQRRDDGAFPLRQVARRYALHTVTGLILGAGAYAVSPALFLWMSPVAVGLALAIPLAAVTGTRRAGRALRRAGLLLTPEERRPPAVLARAIGLRRELERRGPGPAESVRRLFEDRDLLDAHRRMLPPPRRPRHDPVDPPLAVGLAKLAEADSLDEALASLDVREKAAVLADGGGLDRLSALPRR